MGKVRSKSFRFTKKADRIIIKHMKESPICYVKIKEKIPEYTTKQIRQRWKNQLDPKLCHDPLNEDEEKLIIKLVKKNQEPNGKICWKNVIPEVEAETSKFRSENKLKNFWYSKRGQLLSKNYEEAIFPQDDVVLLSQDDDTSCGARDDDDVLPSRDDNDVLTRLDQDDDASGGARDDDDVLPSRDDNDVLTRLDQDDDASGGARDDDDVLPSRDDNDVLTRLDILCQEAFKYDFLQ